LALIGKVKAAEGIPFIRTKGIIVASTGSDGSVTLSIDTPGSGRVTRTWSSRVPPEDASDWDDEFDDFSFNTKLWESYDPHKILSVIEDAYGLKLEFSDDCYSNDSIAGIFQESPSATEFEFVSSVSLSSLGNCSSGLFISGDVKKSPVTSGFFTVSLSQRNKEHFVEISNYSNNRMIIDTLVKLPARSLKMFFCVQYSKKTSEALVWCSDDGINWSPLLDFPIPLISVPEPKYFGIYGNPCGNKPMILRSEFFRFTRAEDSGIMGTIPDPVGAVVSVYKYW